jgi:ABC-type glycerol-3-phosphate transport system substrate-binding protein
VRGLALLLVAALALAACGGDDDEATVPAASAGVEELSNVLDLRANFEDDAGKTRMVVLFSPT